MCCEQAHICQCHPIPRSIMKQPRCIRCSDVIGDDKDLYCIECEEGKQWPAN